MRAGQSNPAATPPDPPHSGTARVKAVFRCAFVPNFFSTKTRHRTTIHNHRRSPGTGG